MILKNLIPRGEYEAVLWDGNNHQEVLAFVGDAPLMRGGEQRRLRFEEGKLWTVHTTGACCTFRPNEYLVRRVGSDLVVILTIGQFHEGFGSPTKDDELHT